MIFAIVHYKDSGEEIRVNMSGVSLFPPDPNGDLKGCSMMFPWNLHQLLAVSETMDEVFASLVSYE